MNETLTGLRRRIADLEAALSNSVSADFHNEKVAELEKEIERMRPLVDAADELVMLWHKLENTDPSTSEWDMVFKLCEEADDKFCQSVREYKTKECWK